MWAGYFKKEVKNMAKVKYQSQEVRAEYRRQRSRLSRFFKRASERGYIWEKSFIPDIPKVVTEASVRRLKKLTPEILYKKSYKTADYESGELIPGEKARKLERKESAKKSAETRKKNKLKKQINEALKKDTEGLYKREIKQDYPIATDVIINNFMSQIDQWTPKGIWSDVFRGIKESDKNTLKNIINGAINDQGKEAVAVRIEDNANELNDLFAEILYGSGSTEYEIHSGRKRVQLDLQRVASIVRGRSLTPRESLSIMNAMEENEFE